MTRRVLASLVALACVPALAGAHHSYAGFDETPATIRAEVLSFQWANPHALLELRADDGGRYLVVLAAPNALVRRGYTRNRLLEALGPGERLTVTGRFKRGETTTEVLPEELAHGVYGVVFSR